MSGSDKQRLLVIGKSRDPRCFRGKKSLPVVYRSSAKAWMTSDIFREWLKDFNKQMVSQNWKVLLLVDNCSAHPKDAADRLSNVKQEFLLSNTTSVIQPCDQGIIINLKTLYRSQVVRKIINEIDSVCSATDIARKLTLLYAVHLLSKAWKGVKTSTVVNCYRKAGFVQETVAEEEEEIDIPEGFNREEFLNYVDSDTDLVTTGYQQMKISVPSS
ncbi:tigger transposable element-derived protein 6-like [Ostrea edulis]|uniref:tigger transposable element-derived protein 6-like n=1 Tax=Ostrea edulis TaxID=37623 RepID=UPI0024AEF2B6|nr:tigger transposable element-derived protein 6-like [Ostrea edulis]